MIREAAKEKIIAGWKGKKQSEKGVLSFYHGRP